jgi:hypothetical protein
LPIGLVILFLLAERTGTPAGHAGIGESMDTNRGVPRVAQ